MTQKLYLITFPVMALKIDQCFYNTPGLTETGECKQLSACQMCPGNSFTIEYICQNSSTIPAVETLTVLETFGC